MSRILVHFSCGAASAVAWRVAVLRYGSDRDVEAIYCDLSRDEHPDNARFMADVERWVGRKATVLSHPKFKTIDDLFLARGFIGSRHGAACTRTLKREVAEAYARPDDTHVFGYTADEQKRIATFALRNPEVRCLWLLASAGVRKEDCYHILSAAGIELPAMYRMGYGHNNCIGCVKGGKGYWNKIRRDFPDVFARRAAVQRMIGPGACFRSGGTGFMLDELDPEEGRDVPEPAIECGVLCNRYADLMDELTAPAGREEQDDGNGIRKTGHRIAGRALHATPERHDGRGTGQQE